VNVKKEIEFKFRKKSKFVSTTVLTLLLTAVMATLGIFMQPIPLIWFDILLIAAFAYILICNGLAMLTV